MSDSKRSSAPALAAPASAASASVLPPTPATPLDVDALILSFDNLLAADVDSDAADTKQFAALLATAKAQLATERTRAAAVKLAFQAELKRVRDDRDAQAFRAAELEDQVKTTEDFDIFDRVLETLNSHQFGTVRNPNLKPQKTFTAGGLTELERRIDVSSATFTKLTSVIKAQLSRLRDLDLQVGMLNYEYEAYSTGLDAFMKAADNNKARLAAEKRKKMADDLKRAEDELKSKKRALEADEAAAAAPAPKRRRLLKGFVPVRPIVEEPDFQDDDEAMEISDAELAREEAQADLENSRDEAMADGEAV
jgi:hypothetical protein